MSAPAAGSTVSGASVTVSAAASNDIVSVQFQLDGVDLGALDTTAPYSIAWEHDGSCERPHTLSAVARDAANNTATATGVGVNGIECDGGAERADGWFNGLGSIGYCVGRCWRPGSGCSIPAGRGQSRGGGDERALQPDLEYKSVLPTARIRLVRWSRCRNNTGDGHGCRCDGVEPDGGYERAGCRVNGLRSIGYRVGGLRRTTLSVFSSSWTALISGLGYGLLPTASRGTRRSCERPAHAECGGARCANNTRLPRASV